MGQARLTSSATGALLGCALGDAIGELAFGHPTKDDLRAAVAAQSRLVYTDDTAMTIALAESLIARRGLDPDDLGRRFATQFAREPWRGYGPGPPRIFALVERTGMSYPEAARQLYGGEGSFGNGAAMRIAPIGVAYRDGDELREAACRSAEVTHAHPIGQDGAAVQALAVGIATAHALEGRSLDPARTAERLVEAARTPEIRQKMQAVARLLAEGAPAARVADAVGRSIAVQESMPFAVYAFLQAPEDFEACLDCAILNGGDRDTLGAMAGAIAGAYLGMDALPPGWRAAVENGEELTRLARTLAECFSA